MADVAWAAASAVAVSIAINAVLIHLANTLGTLDRPVARSSHDRPKPTLGGVGIVGGFWAGVVNYLWLAGDLLPPLRIIAALALATAVILLFVRDDVGPSLGVGQKTAIQLLATAVWLYWGFNTPTLTLPLAGSLTLGLGMGTVVAALVMVGACNVYNFMDGIDGLMAWNTLAVGSMAAYLLFQLGSSWWLVALLLVAATAGFALFNHFPARIFSGDIGAMFVGFLLAVMALHGERIGLPIWAFALLLAPFLFDTAYTLIRRAINGENVLRAHRKHLYQRLGNLGAGGLSRS